MAEKIHFQQAGLLKGCPSPLIHVFYIQRNSVEPSDQFRLPALISALFFHHKKHPAPSYLYEILSFLLLFYSYLKKKNIGLSTIPLDSTQYHFRFFGLSQILFPVYPKGINLPIKHLFEFTSRLSGLVFSSSTTLTSNQNAHWRTIVVTQQ